MFLSSARSPTAATLPASDVYGLLLYTPLIHGVPDPSLGRGEPGPAPRLNVGQDVLQREAYTEREVKEMVDEALEELRSPCGELVRMSLDEGGDRPLRVPRVMFVHVVHHKCHDDLRG